MIYAQADMLADYSVIYSSFQNMKTKLVFQTELNNFLNWKSTMVTTNIIIQNTTFSRITSSTAVILLKGTNIL